jgi:serine protease Do
MKEGILMDYEVPAYEKKPSFWSYLMVGIVGAVIGGFLVLGIAPQILTHRAGYQPMAASGPGGGAATTPPPVYLNATDLEDPYAAIMLVAQEVSPAVVGITNQASMGFDFFGREYVQDTGGTGVIISEDGYIVTNEHVVANAKSLMVYLADGRSFPATVVGAEKSTDLAVIKIDATGLPKATFGDSDDLKIGQLAVAIGNPLGMEFSRTVTAGIISGLDRILNVSQDSAIRLIQTDAVINPGNSGGPLVNAKGEVVGLNSMKLASAQVEGMGFAIPSNQVKRVAEEIIETGRVRRAVMGVKLADKELVRRNNPNIKIDRGVYVDEVLKGGAAHKAGMLDGDIIIEVGGVPVQRVNAIRAYLSEKSPGDKLVVKVLRGSAEMVFELILQEAES